MQTAEPLTAGCSHLLHPGRKLQQVAGLQVGGLVNHAVPGQGRRREQAITLRGRGCNSATGNPTRARAAQPLPCVLAPAVSRQRAATMPSFMNDTTCNGWRGASPPEREGPLALHLVLLKGLHQLPSLLHLMRIWAKGILHASEVCSG